LLYLAHDGLASAARQPALSIAALFSITASLLVLAVTFLITSNLERQATAIESRRVIDVYLADRAAPATRAALEQGLAAIDGVSGVRYVSKEKLASFRAAIGRDDLIDALG
jgi:cell division protein FtsX